MRKLCNKKPLASLLAFLMIWPLSTTLLVTQVKAQASTGTIRGTVTDQNGAVVSGASVTATNQGTGVTSPTYKTTGDGIYSIPNLNPGKYTLTVESSNFKKAVFTDVVVDIAKEVIIDAALQTGGVAEAVTVTAGTEEAIVRDTAQVSQTFESRKVAELPSNGAGNGIDTLALLAPGVVPGVAGNSNGTTLSVNGNRSRSNNFTIDGQDNNDLSVAGPAFFIDNQDVVGEFQVVTNNFSAQYGRNQGAQVNIVSKSGTKDFHGTGFWFHRDQANFDSLDNIEKRNGQTSPSFLLSNIYGGTLGGPIPIPGLKDRLFFFGSYQGIKIRQNAIVQGSGEAILPSDFAKLKATFPNNPAIAILADFSAFNLTGLGPVSPRTGVSGGPFDKLSLPIDPSMPCDASHAGNCATFNTALPQRMVAFPFDETEYTIRSDAKITDKDSVWGSFLYQDSNAGNGAQGNAEGWGGSVPANGKKAGATWNHQISSTAINSVFGSYSRLFVDFGGGCLFSGAGCIPDISQIANTFPNIAFGGVRGARFGLQTVGGATNLPQGRIVQTYQVSDTFQLTRGKHAIQAGADLKRLVNNTTVIFNFQGAFGSFNAKRLVQNNPGAVTFAAGNPTIDFNETDQAYFVQDDWRIRDNLTMNLGIRYENSGQPVNALHDLTVKRESDPAQAFFRQNLPLEARTVPKFPTPDHNFAPRFGFAWTPRPGSGFLKRILGEDATVLRGGYGIAYDPAFYNILIFLSTGTPTVFSNTVANLTTPSAATFIVPSANPTAASVQAFAASNGLIAKNLLDPRFLSQSVLTPNFHSPYAEQWSFGIQRQINRNNVAEVRYLGTHGVSLFENRDANPRIDRLVNGFTTTVGGQSIKFPGFPNLVPQGISPVACAATPGSPDNTAACNGRIIAGQGIVTETGNHGQSIYHSLQAQYRGRVKNQLTLQSSYTWSKVLDTASEVIGLTTAGSLSQAAFNITGAERGYALFDRRHNFSLGSLWDIPAFKDQKGILGHVLGGWQLNGVYLIASGRRWTVQNGFNPTLNALGVPVYSQQVTAERMRPFYGNPNAPGGTVGITGIDLLLGALGFGWPTAGVAPTTALYSVADLNNGKVTPVSKDAVRYIVNGPGSALLFNNPYGDVPRNSEKGPRINQLNASVFKNTRVSERLTVQFRAEFFNVLNHPNPGYGNTSVGGSTPPSRTVVNAGVSGFAFNDPGEIELARRVVQLGLRFIF
jgi:hypothetical protein